ncbi:MAG: sensor histidine kinase [Terriglobales bacterium]
MPWRRPMPHLPERILRWLTANIFRSTAIFVVLTFVPILLLTYYIVATSIQNSRADAARTDIQVRDFSADLLRTSFREEMESLAGVADQTYLHNALANTRPETLSRILSIMVRRRNEFAVVALYDSAGDLLAEASPPGAPAVAAPALADAAPWFNRVNNSQQPYISPLRNLSGAGPALILAAPVTQNGETGGVLMAELPASVIAGWVAHIGGNGRYVYLVDRNRRIVAGPANGPLPDNDVGLLPGVRQALAGRTGRVDFLAPIHLESQAVSYAPLPLAGEAVLVVRPVRLGIYFLKVFYDKLALIAIIVFLLAVISGLLLRAAFRYYLRYTREVETGRSKTEALLSNLGDAVFAVDPQLRIMEFNPAAASLSGLAAGEVMGRQYPEVLHFIDEGTGQEALDLIPRALEQRHQVRFSRNLRLRRKDGTEVPVAVNAAPMLDDQGGVSGCVVVFSDVTQEREVDRMKTEFISLASHQLRTPMTGVKGALSLLLDEVLGPLTAEQRRYLGRAYEANERLIALVGDLLNVSRLEQGRMQLIWEPVELGQLLTAVGSDMQPQAARYHQQLRLDLGGRELQTLGDPVRLREVFVNLVDNAIKYTPDGGSVTVWARAEDQSAVIEVRDTGVGIPAEQSPGLFQKVTRVENPLSGRDFGTGLGLYFVKSVVELHHGSIIVTSQPEHGSTFTVRLPLRPAAPPPEAGRNREAAASHTAPAR